MRRENPEGPIGYGERVRTLLKNAKKNPPSSRKFPPKTSIQITKKRKTRPTLVRLLHNICVYVHIKKSDFYPRESSPRRILPSCVNPPIDLSSCLDFSFVRRRVFFYFFLRLRYGLISMIFNGSKRLTVSVDPS